MEHPFPKKRNRMKKIFSLLFILSFCLLCLSSCDNSTSSNEEFYKIELGAVSTDTYNSAMNKVQNITIVNYNEIYTIRSYLHENTLSDYQVQNGVSSTEIREFLESRQFSNNQVATEMNFLQKNGNDIIFFEHAFDPEKKIWMYITK